MMAAALRGERLLEAIRHGLIVLVAENPNFVYSGTILSARIGVSRVSLNKHQIFVRQCLTDLGINTTNDRRKSTRRLRQRMGHLEQENVQLKIFLTEAWSHIVELYSDLHSASIPAQSLVQPAFDARKQFVDNCPVCGGQIGQT